MLNSRIELIIVDVVLLTIVVLLSFLLFNKFSTYQTTTNSQISRENVGDVSPTDVPTGVMTKGDLSYIIVTVNDENSQISLTDDAGKKVGEVSIEEPISDALGQSTNTVGSLNTLNFAKPASGIYSLDVTLTKDSYIDIYLYDEGKGTLTKTINGKKGDNQIKINFDKANASNSSAE